MASAIPSSSVASSPSSSQCMLTLYHKDSRLPAAIQMTGYPPIPQYLDKKQLSLVEQTAQTVTDAIAAHFKVDKEWDKKLLGCVFLGDAQAHSYCFTRTDSPDIAWSVSITEGERGAIFRERPKELYVPIQRPGRISLRTSGDFGSSTNEFDYEEIKRVNNDYRVVALFNSESFTELTEYSRYKTYSTYKVSNGSFFMYTTVKKL